MGRQPPAGVVVNYELQPIRCGKPRCRCNSDDKDDWHGPYWYAYWNDPRSGKKRSQYKGAHFEPPTVERSPQIAASHPRRRR